MDEHLRHPPGYCHYADGPCDQPFSDLAASKGVLLYPSEPAHIAATIEAARQRLEVAQPDQWRSWKRFGTTGQIIFCSICNSCRFAESVLADVTTLNFNLMFEIGFTIGLGIRLCPIRDTTYAGDRKDFDELGILA